MSASATHLWKAERGRIEMLVPFTPLRFYCNMHVCTRDSTHGKERCTSNVIQVPIQKVQWYFFHV